jgi:hypothetical protein
MGRRRIRDTDDEPQEQEEAEEESNDSLKDRWGQLVKQEKEDENE